MPAVGRLTASSSTTASEAARVVVEVDANDGQALLGFALRLGLTPEQADDAVQEVLLRLFRSLRDGAAIEDPRAWGFRTLYRLAMDEHRLRRRLRGLAERLLTRSPRPDAGGPDRDMRLSIWAEVDRLPARQRQVLYLHYQADLAFDEIARIMGITAGGARAVAARGISTLRRSVEPEDAG